MRSNDISVDQAATACLDRLSAELYDRAVQIERACEEHLKRARGDDWRRAQILAEARGAIDATNWAADLAKRGADQLRARG